MKPSLIVVPKLRFSEPCRNLPGHKGVATAEDRFTIAFMRAYLNQAAAIHRKAKCDHLAYARQIPVNGYGIADLLVVAWKRLPDKVFPSGEAFVTAARPTCRAFEMKICNWQKALSQASRYRFFAHQAIVVLPPEACSKALRVLDTFKRVGVGLWRFDPKTNRIVAYFTPRALSPRSRRYWYHSLEKVAKASKSTLPIHGTTECLFS